MTSAAFLLLLGLVLLSAVTAEPQRRCLKERQLAQNKPLVGSYVPQCEKNGNYSPKQCHGSTGMCWCVNINGKEIAGTRTKPGQSPPKCGGTAEKPGECQVIPTLIACKEDPNPACDTDRDCNGPQKCCNYACHMQCRDPIA